MGMLGSDSRTTIDRWRRREKKPCVRLDRRPPFSLSWLGAMCGIDEDGILLDNDR